MIDRYFYAGKLDCTEVELTGPQAHHLIRVKRARLGEIVELFDGRGNAVRAEVTKLEKQAALLRIDQPGLGSHTEKVPAIEVIVASAVPKGDRFRWLIEKLTETGITRFIPLMSEHAVVSPRDTKLDKHRQYVIEACKQSGRNHLMEISAPRTLQELCGKMRDQEKTRLFVGQPHGEVVPISQFNNGLTGEITTVILVIGPEGGFTRDECELLEENRAVPVCCSPHVLRIETAALVMSSLALSLLYGKFTGVEIPKRI